MEREELIEKLKVLKKERGSISKIEWEVGMPENSLSRYIMGHAQLPEKWINPIAEYILKKESTKYVELPKDFIGVDKIAILRADGTIEEIKDAEQLPPEWVTKYFKDHPESLVYTKALSTAMAGIKEIQEKPDKEQLQGQLATYEEELKTLGDGVLAKQRRRFLEGRINEIKRQLR